MIYRYEIEDVPPSNNRFLGRNNRYKYAEEKSKWEKLIKYTATSKPLAPIKRSKITITYGFTDKRRRDPDNYSGKFILDGLTKVGIIEDDSFYNIDLKLCAVFGVKKARTVIEVEETEC